MDATRVAELKSALKQRVDQIDEGITKGVKVDGSNVEVSQETANHIRSLMGEATEIKSLLDAGIRLESVRQVFDYVREHLGEDIGSANIVISGTSTVLVRSGDELIDVLRKGQGVLNVLALSGVKDEVDARIVELFPVATAEDRAHHPSAAGAGAG